MTATAEQGTEAADRDPSDRERRRSRRRAGPPVADRGSRRSGAIVGPKVERRGVAGHAPHRRRDLRADLRRRVAEGGLLGLRGPRLHQQAPRRVRRLRPRRHDDVADHLRRDAPRLLRAQGAARRHGHQLGRGVALVPDVPAVLRPDVPRGEGPRARRSVRLRVQRLDGRGVVRRQRRSADPARRSSRCGTRSSPPPRSGATRPVACARSASARSRRTSGLPSIHTGYWDPFFVACQETQTVVCMHIGSSSKMPATSVDAPVAVAATLSFGNAMSSLVGLPLLRGARALPEAEARVLRGPDRLDPVHPRARRRRVARAPGLGWRQGHRARSRRRPTTTARCTAASSATCTGSSRSQRVGVDNTTFETDYPHTDSTWPHTKELAGQMMADLPQDVVDKICRGNAIRMLGLDL